MFYKNNKSASARAEVQYVPRAVGSILQELVNTSDSLLYKGYRKFLVPKEPDAEKGGKDDE